MDVTKIRKSRNSSNPGELSAAIYGGIQPRRRDRYGEIEDGAPALHGEHTAAIDLEPVRESWRGVWRAVLSGCTPIQRAALLDVIRDHEAAR